MAVNKYGFKYGFKYGEQVQINTSNGRATTSVARHHTPMLVIVNSHGIVITFRVCQIPTALLQIRKLDW